VAAKVRKRLAVNKPLLHRFHIEGFSLKKLTEADGKEKCRVRFVEDLDTEMEINHVWETIPSM
jgi:hypothetical protein